MEVTVKPKTWGNSLGIIIPKQIIRQEKITVKDELIIHIEKIKDKEKAKLMKEGYLEMGQELTKVNEEWEKADYEE